MAIFKLVLLTLSINIAAVGITHASQLDRLVVQHKNVQISCFPKKLITIIKKVQHKLRQNVIITSGFRKGSKRSMHATCKAADFRVFNVSRSKMIHIFKNIPEIGGYGTYRRKPGLYHVDIGPTRHWSH